MDEGVGEFLPDRGGDAFDAPFADGVANLTLCFGQRTPCAGARKLVGELVKDGEVAHVSGASGQKNNLVEQIPIQYTVLPFASLRLCVRLWRYLPLTQLQLAPEQSKLA